MRYLMQKYYEHTRELNTLRTKLEDSWQNLFTTSQMSDIPLHEKPSSIINGAVILEILCKEKLTEDQIKRIEKASSSSLLNTTPLKEIHMRTQEVYPVYDYEFIGCQLENSKTLDVTESWLKD